MGLRTYSLTWIAFLIAFQSRLYPQPTTVGAVAEVEAVGITVSDADRLAAFFTEVLSFEKVSEREVWGTDDERLQGVFGARLRITALRASSGPGIELLEYLTPRGGRPMPRDVQSNDVFHWQTILVTRSVQEAAQRLRAGNHWFVSPGVVELGHGSALYRQSLVVRDPDGHALQLVEK